MSFRDNLWSDDLSRVELAPALLAAPETLLRDAVETMRRACSGWLLIARAQVPVGIFTERDLVKRVWVGAGDLNAPVSRYMTVAPVCLRLTDPVGLAIRKMHQGGYRRLPVVDVQGLAIGVVSARRIVRYLADHFPLAVYNLPPTSRQVQEAREGA